MKILHINTHELFGEGARAAYRLHKGLNKYGIDSQILVRYKQSYETSIQSLRRTFLLQSIFSINLLTLSELVKNINPDIIHLHWITDQFINLNDLIKLNKPVNKNTAREILNFEIDKQIILSGVVSYTSDSHKGFDLLIKALQLLLTYKYQLGIFRSSNLNDTLKKLNAKSIGGFHDDYSLKLLYNAANVMTISSRQDISR
ncbi:MAG: hypothetical protein EKK54_00930 [Neisseriaceae bacterium]|nr:MAG: hypothetical protein EKK54_00930 [Neisseriaceae bacterium]